jgi:hypothetical protein
MLDLVDPLDPVDPVDQVDQVDSVGSTSAKAHARCQQHQRQPHARRPWRQR